ncbi:MAG: HAD family hydrolase [Parcubacteria group bacterium]|jgi:FMN phosphatase YigB (HAD superfamily)
MKIILDFDDVLFNTKAFKRDLINVFKKNGVSEKDFLATYKDYPVITKKGILKYDPFWQIKILGERRGIDVVKTRQDMLEFLNNCPQYVFRDATGFLKKFSKNKLYLVSYGHTGFQDKKIEQSGLGGFFGKIVVTDKMKAAVMRRFIRKGKDMVFIDDRVDQINAVKKYFPNSLTFLLKRKERRYDDKKTKYVDYEIKCLKDAVKIINSVN